MIKKTIIAASIVALVTSAAQAQYANTPGSKRELLNGPQTEVATSQQMCQGTVLIDQSWNNYTVTLSINNLKTGGPTNTRCFDQRTSTQPVPCAAAASITATASCSASCPAQPGPVQSSISAQPTTATTIYPTNANSIAINPGTGFTLNFPADFQAPQTPDKPCNP